MSEVKSGYVEVHRWAVLISSAALEVLIEKWTQNGLPMKDEKIALSQLRAAMDGEPVSDSPLRR